MQIECQLKPGGCTEPDCLTMGMSIKGKYAALKFCEIEARVAARFLYRGIFTRQHLINLALNQGKDTIKFMAMVDEMLIFQNETVEFGEEEAYKRKRIRLEKTGKSQL